MAAKPKQAQTGNVPTGRYIVCPSSGLTHPVIFAQVQKGPKAYWYMCGHCSRRGFLPGPIGYPAPVLGKLGPLLDDLLRGFTPPPAAPPRSS